MFASFLEVATLLINGSLPTKAELEAFENSIMRHTMVNEQLLRFQSQPPEALSQPTLLQLAARGLIA